jgi:hypothetical protein
LDGKPEKSKKNQSRPESNPNQTPYGMQGIMKTISQQTGWKGPYLCYIKFIFLSRIKKKAEFHDVEIRPF